MRPSLSRDLTYKGYGWGIISYKWGDNLVATCSHCDAQIGHGYDRDTP